MLQVREPAGINVMAGVAEGAAERGKIHALEQIAGHCCNRMRAFTVGQSVQDLQVLTTSSRG